MKLTFLFILSLVIITIIFLNSCTKRPNYITIGKQVWMKENLNIDHYRNGDLIPEIKDPTKWAALKTGAWCYTSWREKEGKLYNWYAVNDPRGLAPEGWHVPSVAELLTLKSAVSGQGNSLKEIGEGNINGVGTNESGFSALLFGARGELINIDHRLACFWSSDQFNDYTAYSMNLLYDDNDIGIYNDWEKFNGYSVRCLKN